MSAGTVGGPDPVRFAFGENWRRYSLEINQERMEGAHAGVARLLGTSNLSGKRFLDVGCGSGLMSLAAHRMGANVTAFDYDNDSVETAIALRNRYADPQAYEILRGSALDAAFVRQLGVFDVVYAWGVLHHTGDMWRAFEVVRSAVAPGGTLALAIYNDQGLASRVWNRVKKAYVHGGPLRRRTLISAFGSYFRTREFAARMILQQPALTRPRGMDRHHDLVDWVGGYPFEVARPEEVFRYYRDAGFILRELRTCQGGLGCNEFVFHLAASTAH